ncbi:MAG: hypothetical protein HRU21_11950 [Pseudomonadales bacterium]|nr:hypothetical protein [Pseudomonadales bacterium]
MSWVITATVGLKLFGDYQANKQQKKQAKAAAAATERAGNLDSVARQKAIGVINETYPSAIATFNDTMRNTLDMFQQAQISSSELLTNSAENVERMISQGGQNALHAMLGLPAPAQNQPVDQQGNTEAQSRELGGIKPAMPESQASQMPQTFAQTDGTFRMGGQQQMINQPDQVSQGQVAQEPVRSMGMDDFTPQKFMGRDPGSDENMMRIRDAQERNQAQQAQQASPVQAQQVMEGEFIPREAPNLQQQNITMPTGTNAGFMGAEQSVVSAGDQARTDMMAGAEGALSAMGTRFGGARGDIEEGRNFSLGQHQKGIDAGQAGTRTGVQSVEAGVNRAIGYQQPYMSAGKEALNPYMALTGTRGQQAFDDALINDPAYNLALMESERSLGRNAAVTGGMGSGNTKGRFQLNAQQQAAADVDRQLNRYRGAVNMGQNAANQAGGYSAQGGAITGQMQQQGGRDTSNMMSRMGDVGTMSASQLSELAKTQGLSEAQILQQLGGNLSNIGMDTGRTVGGMRETAGINAANILQGTTGQQVSNEQNLTNNLYGLDQGTVANMGNTMQSAAGTTLQSELNQANSVANMNIGAGTSAANTAMGMGQAEMMGITNPWGNMANTVSGALSSTMGMGTPTPYGASSPSPYASSAPMNLNYSQMPAMPSYNSMMGTTYNPQINQRQGTTYNPPITF